MPNPWRSSYVGFTWAQRAAILKRDRYCPCGRPATEADHRRSVADCQRAGIDPNTLDNGQGLCPDCHALKTAAEKRQGQQRMVPRRPPRPHP